MKLTNITIRKACQKKYQALKAYAALNGLSIGQAFNKAVDALTGKDAK